MGDKRVSKRTLSDGLTALHYPPDDQHPEGKLVLLRDSSPVRDHLNERHEHHQARHEDLKATHTGRTEVKIARGQAKGLPHEKSPI